MDKTMRISDRYGVEIKHIESCFMEKVPRECLCITDNRNYNSPIHTLYLTFDELDMLNQAISEYIKAMKGE
jgi:hypothetical protein